MKRRYQNERDETAQSLARWPQRGQRHFDGASNQSTKMSLPLVPPGIAVSARLPS